MSNSVLKNHNRRALIGGILATIITLIGPYVLGHISGYEA